jgi:two-component system, NtrC family, sensor kinase
VSSIFSPLNRWVTRKFCYLGQHTFRRVVDRIRNSLELNIVLQTAVDEIAALLNLDRCVFFWYLGDIQQIQVVCERVCNTQTSYLGYYSLAQFGTAAPLIEMGQLVIGGRKVPQFAGLGWISSGLGSSRHEFSFQFNVKFLEANASLLVPIRGREGTLGFLACLADRPRRWSTTELEFMQSISQQLQIAIHQAQLYEKTQRQVRREHLVNQITTQTRQSFNLKTILTQAIAQILDVLEVDRCLIQLLDGLQVECELAPEPAQVKTNHPLYVHPHLFEVCRVPFPPSIEHFNPNNPLTRWVMQTQQRVSISDISQDKRIGVDSATYELAQIKSSLIVPVRADGSLQAILYLHQCSHLRYWMKDDQKLAQAVADQMAISIKQGRLYAKNCQQASASAAQAKHLEETLGNLRKMQAQLIQREKMSSLGQMVAGLAHEINNPISFIYSNIPYIERYVEDLLRLLESYQARYPGADEALEDLMQDIDLEFLVEEVPQTLKSIRSGASRIRDIILSLRNFSPLDESQRKLAEIHETIESALFLLQNQIQGNIRIIRHYDQLPRVECYPRLLNQVFMSLLMNAVEALQRSQSEPKFITITTELIIHDLTGAAWVRVAIADNGCGIPHSIQDKIFDPFFTTKPVGQGAGLGLAVCYQTIVNHHKGSLKFHSELDRGSQFIVEIPVKCPTLSVCDFTYHLRTDVLSPSPPTPLAIVRQREVG